MPVAYRSLNPRENYADRSSMVTQRNNISKSHKTSGFTLVEVVVVLAVVLLLAGIAVPMIGGYIEDSREGRAKAEVKVLAASLAQFYKDVGQMPTRDSAGANTVVRTLYTGTTAPTATSFNSSTTHNFYVWANAAASGDSFDNQLNLNTPQATAGAAYSTTGSARWKGPYLAGNAPLDPWGRPYLANVYSTFSVDPANDKRVFVLSSGPDGVLDTPATATSTDEIGGDDIGIVIYHRR